VRLIVTSLSTQSLLSRNGRRNTTRGIEGTTRYALDALETFRGTELPPHINEVIKALNKLLDNAEDHRRAWFISHMAMQRGPL